MGKHYETNTWPHRHERPLSEAVKALLARGKRNISVSIYGPGGIAEEYKDKLPAGDEENFKGSWGEILHASDVWGNVKRFVNRRKQQLVNSQESPARDKLEARLTCFEPIEIYQLLRTNEIGINDFYVFDKYERVLEGVKSLEIPNVKVQTRDIQYISSPLPQTDLVLALRVLEYCKDRPTDAYEALLNATAEGGILVATIPNNFVPNKFTQLWPQYGDKVKKPERRVFWRRQLPRTRWSGRASELDEEAIAKRTA